jgi:type II secretory pathway component PulC
VQPSVDPFADVPHLEANSPIKLQAISWAQAEKESITVINNTVLHEGDSVEGYTVVKIRPDDVVLRRSGRMWRASFSLR